MGMNPDTSRLEEINKEFFEKHIKELKSEEFEERIKELESKGWKIFEIGEIIKIKGKEFSVINFTEETITLKPTALL